MANVAISTVSKAYSDSPEISKETKEQIIRIDMEIDIPEPMTSGDGGFVPKVDEWDEIHTDIII